MHACRRIGETDRGNRPVLERSSESEFALHELIGHRDQQGWRQQHDANCAEVSSPPREGQRGAGGHAEGEQSAHGDDKEDGAVPARQRLEREERGRHPGVARPAPIQIRMGMRQREGDPLHRREMQLPEPGEPGRTEREHDAADERSGDAEAQRAREEIRAQADSGTESSDTTSIASTGFPVAQMTGAAMRPLPMRFSENASARPSG